MINLFSNNRKLFFVVVALVILILSRFLFLDTSARFVWDESDDLVRMSQMYHRNPITLIGPMNPNKTFFQSSLTYYMLMPITAISNFHPIGPVIMTAIYGVLTVVILAIILSKFFKWNLVYALLFLTILYPLVQTGRWAWNPHFIPFWQATALLLLFLTEKSKKNIQWLLIGFLFTLAFHNHWYAIFSTVGFSLGMLIYHVKKKTIRSFVFYLLGVSFAVLPLLIFDILHPPGLFITRALFFSPLSPSNGGLNFLSIPLKFITFPIDLISYFIHVKWVSILVLLIFIIYVICVIKDGSTSTFKKILILPIISQIFGLTFIGGSVFDYYYLGAVVAFILFITIPDKNTKINLLRICIVLIIIVFSIKPSYNEIKKDTWMTNIGRKLKIYNIIKSNLPKDKRCNVFVPASKSGDATGNVYRDMLIARDDIWLYSKEEYNSYQCLFVVSTASLEKIVKDPAYELNLIRKLKPSKKWDINDENWIVYYYEVKDTKIDD